MTRVVAIGGGHGLAATLRAVRRYADEITAVVSVADDGGSSGRLRAALGIPAPGDLRRCLAALAAEGSTWAEALEHRFDDGAGELGGHALGNLVIAGLAEATGDFVAALDEVARVVGACGRVLPATCEPVVLKAEIEGRGDVRGQVAVEQTGHPISRVSLVPADPPAPPDVLAAIAAADQVVIGPGSLYTSILAAVAVPDVRQALETTSARKVYVCNLRPQIPETAGYTVSDHVRALQEHGVTADVVLAHTPDRPLAHEGGSAHDPVLLANALADLVL